MTIKDIIKEKVLDRFIGEVSLLTGVYWIMGQSGLSYDDEARDAFIKKWKRRIK